MAQKITKMTPSVCRQLNTEIEEALAIITEKYGLVVNVKGGSWDPETGYFPKLELGIVSDGGVPADFKRLAPLYNLDVEDYGKEIRLGSGNSGKTVTPSQVPYLSYGDRNQQKIQTNRCSSPNGSR